MNVRQLSALVALAAVGTVAILPRTASLARLELKSAVVGAARLGNASPLSPSVAAEHPDRFDFQLGAAGDSAARLKSLAERYADQPAAQAALAIALTKGITLDHRRELDAFSSKPQSHRHKPVVVDAETLVAAANRGAALEPDNGFFPTMAALGLLELGRDDEAYAALGRASAAPRWDEHLGDMVRGRWALAEASQGSATGLSKTAIAAAILYPHYAPLRNLARVFVGQAIAREKAGDIEGGIRLRKDVLAVGVRMSDQSSSLIGNLVGLAVRSLVANQPGGAPKVVNQDKTEASAQRARDERAAQWDRWVRANGHPELAGIATDADAYRKRISGLFEAAAPNNPADLSQVLRECALIGGGLALLATAMWSVLLGGIFRALRRSPRVRSGEPMPRAAKLGLWAGAAEVALVPTALALGGESQVWGAWAACGAPLVLLTMALLKNEASVLVTLERFWGAALSLLGAVALAGWISVGSASMIAGAGGANAWVVFAVGGVAALVVPLLAIAALAIRARRRDVPASAEVVRTFPKLAVPLASVVLVAWAAHLFPLAAFEDRLQDALTQTVTHEGKALSRWAGRAWPGDSR